MIKDIRVLLLGTGNWGKNHYRSLSALTQNFRFFDVNSEAYANWFESNKLYLERPSDIDAVIISTTSSNHFELTKYWLEMGKHVLIEKPVVKNRQELDELIKIAEERPKQVIMAGHTMLFHNAIHTIKDFIDQGYFREETSPRIILRRMKYNPIIGDDEIYRLIPHDLSILDYFGWLNPETLALAKDETLTNKYANVVVSWLNKETIRDLYINNNLNNVLYFDDSRGLLLYNNQVVEYDNSPPLLHEQLHFLNLIDSIVENNPVGIEHIKRVYGELTRVREWKPREKNS